MFLGLFALLAIFIASFYYPVTKVQAYPEDQSRIIDPNKKFYRIYIVGLEKPNENQSLNRFNNSDSDGDGCSNVEETLLGGPSFNRNDPYDIFDVPVPTAADPAPNGQRNKIINEEDVSAVLFYVGATENGPPNANGVDYDSDKNHDGIPDGRDYDRSAGLPKSPGDLYDPSGPPDGVISMVDVLAVSAQVGLNCSN